MAEGTAAPVVGGLATGIGFVVLFSVILGGQPASEDTTYAEVSIPKGASLESNDISYEPEVAIVFLGVNSTVRWTNHDEVAHGIQSDMIADPAFNESAGALLAPGESFTYNFTKPGMYEYYGVPGPHLHGVVLVLPEIDKKPYVDVTILGLQESYNVDEPVRFSALIEGYETGCGTVKAIMTEKESGANYGTSLVADCSIDSPFHDLKWNLPVDYTGEMFSIPVDRPGTYELVVTYEANITYVKGEATALVVVRE